MKEGGTKQYEQLKHMGLKIQEVTPIYVANTEKKRKNNISDKLYIPARGIYLQKLPLELTLQLNQWFNIIFQL